MKKFTFLLTIAASLLLTVGSFAQTNIIICGSVVGTNGVPVTVYIADSTSGITDSIITDTNGNFCDTITVNSTQG
ncbi:MAG: hypothetical protein HKN75_00735, partial [Bacteroidia bacterium]|nr:hypothetical protein [Bacteroidia bacterium]